MQITQDFFWSQLRIAAVAIVAYLSGKGVLTPVDATFATAIITAIGPILVPWLFSIYANLGTLKIPAESKAADVAKLEKTFGPDLNVETSVNGG